MPVAYLRANKFDAPLAKGNLEPGVTHYRSDHLIARKQPALLEVFGQYQQCSVAIDESTRRIDKQCAIGVAIKSDPQIETSILNHSLQVFEMKRAGGFVDVPAVGTG